MIFFRSSQIQGHQSIVHRDVSGAAAVRPRAALGLRSDRGGHGRSYHSAACRSSAADWRCRPATGLQSGFAGRYIGAPRAFTLLELVAVLALVLVLSTLVVAGVGKVRSFAARTSEITAARTLINAFHAASHDKGRVFSGSDRTETLYDLAGNPIPSGLGGIYTSYVFYLLPYLNYEVNGTVIVNREQREVLSEFASVYGNNREYALSIYPALGMNMWVGGNYDTSGTATNASYALTRLDDAVNPGNMIVFASAGIRETWPRPMTVYGRYQVTPPKNMADVSYWSARADSDNPARHGYVHFRWEALAVVAHLDGSVRLLDIDKMRDMRRWSNQAALANDPNWFRGK